MTRTRYDNVLTDNFDIFMLCMLFYFRNESKFVVVVLVLLAVS